MSYVSEEQIREARQMDLLSYLRANDPSELVHISGQNYCTREHDSLKISNGKWYWFSRGFGGVSALDYLIKVKDIPLPQAVEAILGRVERSPPVSYTEKKTEPKRLMLPERNSNAEQVIRYLRGRGIHPAVIQYCLDHKLLYLSMLRGASVPAGEFNIAIDKLENVLKNAKGYYEFVGTKGRSRVILRFNINSFKNGYTISDLLKMNLSIYAIKVGRTTLDMLNVSKELDMDVSIIPKDNPSYVDEAEPEEGNTGRRDLDVFDVLLAGVESDD